MSFDCLTRKDCCGEVPIPVKLRFGVAISLLVGTTICITPGGGWDEIVTGLDGSGPTTEFHSIIGGGCKRRRSFDVLDLCPALACKSQTSTYNLKGTKMCSKCNQKSNIYLINLGYKTCLFLTNISPWTLSSLLFFITKLCFSLGWLLFCCSILQAYRHIYWQSSLNHCLVGILLQTMLPFSPVLDYWGLLKHYLVFPAFQPPVVSLCQPRKKYKQCEWTVIPCM